METKINMANVLVEVMPKGFLGEDSDLLKLAAMVDTEGLKGALHTRYRQDELLQEVELNLAEVSGQINDMKTELSREALALANGTDAGKRGGTLSSDAKRSDWVNAQLSGDEEYGQLFDLQTSILRNRDELRVAIQKTRRLVKEQEILHSMLSSFCVLATQTIQASATVAQKRVAELALKLAEVEASKRSSE